MIKLYSINLIESQLKIIFYLEEYGTVVKIAEAEINLAFYINNQLPSIIDKVPIINRFDEDAYVDFSLEWQNPKIPEEDAKESSITIENVNDSLTKNSKAQNSSHQNSKLPIEPK